MKGSHLAKPLDTKQAVIYMAVCSLLWSISGLFIKLIPWHSLIITGLRSLIALLVVACYILFAGLKLRINRHTVLTGLFLFLTLAFFVSATKLTTSTNAIVLQYCAPIFIILINALVYKQRPRNKDLFAVLVCTGGMLLCFMDQFSGNGNLLGDLFGVMSGIMLSIFFVLGSRSSSLDNSISSVFIGHSITILFSIPFFFLYPPTFTAEPILYVVILGVFQLGVPYILYGRASRHAPPLVCSLIGLLEPIFNPVWVFIGVGEVPSVFAIAGGLLVVLVVTVWSISNLRDSAPG